MKLVTFDEGRVGWLDGPLVIELDCSSTRQFFERGGRVPETGVRLPLDHVQLRAPIVPRRLLQAYRALPPDERQELRAALDDEA